MDLSQAHAVLQLKPGASALQVGRSYRRLAKTSHPDRHFNDPAAQRRATERMSELNEAYRTIRDAALRRLSGQSTAASAAPTGESAPFARDTAVDKIGRFGCGAILSVFLTIIVLPISWMPAAAIVSGLIAVVLKDRFTRAVERVFWAEQDLWGRFRGL
jgi:curved DNA-binding protein CbpA